MSPVLRFITPFLAEPALSLSKGRGTGGWSKGLWATDGGNAAEVKTKARAPEYVLCEGAE